MNLLLSAQTQSLITRDNITLLLSVIGALGTCITLISSFLKAWNHQTISFVLRKSVLLAVIQHSSQFF